METYTEKVLYGTLKEDPIWKEQILTNQEQHFNEAKAWAERNGFHRLRLASDKEKLAAQSADRGSINGKGKRARRAMQLELQLQQSIRRN